MTRLKIGAFVVGDKEEKKIRRTQWWREFDREKKQGKKILDFFESFYEHSGIRYIPIGWQKGLAMNNGDIIVLKYGKGSRHHS